MPTATDIVLVIRKAPKALTTAGSYAQKVADVAPDAVRVINTIKPLLRFGPDIARYVRMVNNDVATILAKAPQYATVLQKVADTLVKAPEMAREIADATGAAAETATKLGNDPALIPFIERVMLLISLARDAARSKGGGGPATPSTEPGVGLSKVVPWLDRAIAIARHPWLLALPVVAVIGVSGGVGYAIGRSRS